MTSRATPPGTEDRRPAGPSPAPPLPPRPVAGEHPDAAARGRIARDLDETLFVEAGAGSGKTQALVGRIVALVTSGTAGLPEVAAITFTEKAAAELRDRVRHELDDALTRALGVGDTLAAERCGRALDELDGAAIGTLHSFAQRILAEHPIEAGLPPRVEVQDEVASAVAFDDRWSSFVDALLAEPAVERPLLLATAAGARLGALRAIALAFGENWDLALDFAPAEAPEPPPWEHRLTAMLDELDDACCEDAHCRDDADRLLAVIADLRDWSARVRAAGDEFTRLSLLSVDGGRPRARANGKGAKPNWAAGHDLKALRRRIDDVNDRCEALRNEVALAAVERLAVELRRFTLETAAERRAAGRLEFHDLLVLARQMLRDPHHGPSVRRALHARYRRLLIDEFQDTDPIQVDLAVLIATPVTGAPAPGTSAVAATPGTAVAASPAESPLPDDDAGTATGPRAESAPVGRPAATAGRAAAGEAPAEDGAPAPGALQRGATAGDLAWDRLDPAPGRLFFVGDPKQSIYRFRRADISLFLRAAERFGTGGRRLALTTNFRTGEAVVDVVNHLFGRLVRPGDRGGLPSQPPYQPFVAVRPSAPTGPAVAVLGRSTHADRPRAAELRDRESGEVARAVRRALDEGWPVDRSRDPRSPDWQPARPGDITILVPTRTVLPALEDALSDQGISYRAESASLVYASRLVRDLLLTLRAIDDPTDELSVVASLRSPLFACGDDDLVAFRQVLGGHFDTARALPSTVPPDNVVARGLAYLGELHEARLWHAPSELIDRVVRDRRVLELGEAEGATPGPAGDPTTTDTRLRHRQGTGGIGASRARDLWRRVRFVTDQARAWSEATNGTLRQYLDWVRQQTAEGARVAEAVLPETDDDAVRIMTVHAAKGLQFPVTVVTGLTTQPRRWRAEAEVAWPPGRPCLITIGRKVTSEAFEAWKPVDEQMSHDERIRLLYVACTRARDHLVVSLHRNQRARPVDDPARMTSAELLADAAADIVDDLPDAARSTPTTATTTAGTAAAAEGEGEGEGEGDGVGDGSTGDGDGGGRPTGTAERGGPGHDEGDGLLPFEEWRRQRDEALATSSRPRTVAATALTEEGRPDVEDDPGLHKRPRDLDLPPWQKGRYGTAIGRAVHAVLQTVDLATGAGLDAAVAAQAAAEGVTGHEDRIRALALAGLRSPSVVEAAAGPHWREAYVGVPLTEGRLLEGYVDLLYRRPQGGLVIVDYKTGPTARDGDVGPLVERYRVQGASYALAVERATGEAVLAVVFVFLTPDGPVEHPLADLAGSVDRLRRLAESDDPALTVVG